MKSPATNTPAGFAPASLMSTWKVTSTGSPTAAQVEAQLKGHISMVKPSSAVKNQLFVPGSAHSKPEALYTNPHPPYPSAGPLNATTYSYCTPWSTVSSPDQIPSPSSSVIGAPQAPHPFQLPFTVAAS